MQILIAGEMAKVVKSLSLGLLLNYITEVSSNNFHKNHIAPTEKMALLLTKVTAEATCGISEQCIAAEIYLTPLKITELLETLKDTLAIVYPMGLPPYDPIRQELENCEEVVLFLSNDCNLGCPKTKCIHITVILEN